MKIKFRNDNSTDIFTGFLDNDKIEIFENDKIQFAIEGTETHLEIITGVVKFSEKYGAFVIESKKWSGLLYKIIGKIFTKVILEEK